MAKKVVQSGIGAATATVENASRDVVLLGLAVQVITDATVGTRTYVLELRDASNTVIVSITFAVSQVASITVSHFLGVGGIDDGTTSSRRTLPPIGVPAGWDLHVRDTAAISAGDDVRAIATVELA